jgi:hypothetical protein
LVRHRNPSVRFEYDRRVLITREVRADVLHVAPKEASVRHVRTSIVEDSTLMRYRQIIDHRAETSWQLANVVRVRVTGVGATDPTALDALKSRSRCLASHTSLAGARRGP